MVHHRKYPAFDLTKASEKFEVATSNSLGGDAFTRKYIIYFTIDLDLRLRTNTRPCCVSSTSYYVPAKFEAAMSNGLGGNAFTKIFDLTFIQGQGHMKHCPLHHVTYVPAKLLRPMVKEMHYQKKYII